MSKLRSELEAILKEPLGFGRDGFNLQQKNEASVLALFWGESFKASQILLILRSHDLVQNPGQVALPGGALEAIDEKNAIKTALRETEEEVGLKATSISPLGVLPPLSTVTGQFVVNTVLGIWMSQDSPLLILQATEVAHAEWVKVSDLLASRESETRMVHGVEMELPVFHWKTNRMWGLTAMIFDLICRRYDKLFS